MRPAFIVLECSFTTPPKKKRYVVVQNERIKKGLKIKVLDTQALNIEYDAPCSGTATLEKACCNVVQHQILCDPSNSTQNEKPTAKGGWAVHIYNIENGK